MRDTVIGEGTKIDNLCQIGHNCVIGSRCIIAAQSGLSGSVTIEDFAVLGPRAQASSRTSPSARARRWPRDPTVYEDVPAGAVRGGFPAKPKRQWLPEVVALERLAAGGRRGKSRVATPNHSGHVPQQCANLFLGGKQKIGIVLIWRTNPKPRRKPARSSFR
jgi:UDP-3-O-[3-hydroxymyristoyl] glucosamine N-acyltransferase